MSNSKRLDVITIINRTDGKGDERKFWLRIGCAFVNRDGSLNVLLDALPVNGTLHIREPRSEGEGAEDQAPASRGEESQERRPSSFAPPERTPPQGRSFRQGPGDRR